ncbi:hypothetical protein PRIPAC_98043, partial [Pristionchus pacificus]|uniref:Uncharacterized protein n=1 Tax=Pristionchus pacificus TaxID=54126 RepID=A0A2A6CUF5_PRIPA
KLIQQFPRVLKSASLIFPYYNEYCDYQEQHLAYLPVREQHSPKVSQSTALPKKASAKRKSQNDSFSDFKEQSDEQRTLKLDESSQEYSMEEQCKQLTNQLLNKERELNELVMKFKRLEKSSNKTLEKEKEKRRKAEAHFEKVQKVWEDERKCIDARRREAKNTAAYFRLEKVALKWKLKEDLAAAETNAEKARKAWDEEREQMRSEIANLTAQLEMTNKAKEEERNRLEERDRKNSEVAMKWKGRADKMKEEWEMVENEEREREKGLLEEEVAAGRWLRNEAISFNNERDKV